MMGNNGLPRPVATFSSPCSPAFLRVLRVNSLDLLFEFFVPMSLACSYEGKAATHLSSIAIGVGNAVIPSVVRHGWAVVKYSA